MQLAGNVMFVINFFMLGSYTGALLNGICFFRSVILALGKKWSKPWVCILFQLLFITAGVLTYSGCVSMVIAAAQAITTASMWSRNGKAIRYFNFFVNSPAWLWNNIYYFSIGGILAEAFSMLSVIISFIRFGFNGFEVEKSKE